MRYICHFLVVRRSFADVWSSRVLELTAGKWCRRLASGRILLRTTDSARARSSDKAILRRSCVYHNTDSGF